MEDWTEKYRPQRLTAMVGNERAINLLQNWARIWQSGKIPKKRGVILSGKPGIGKTSCAHALAKDFQWIPIELNASDTRNAAMIKKVATSGALHESFDIHGQYLDRKHGGRKLIILDEADNLFEKTSKTAGTDFSDHGGKKAIIDTLKISNQPIILIVNDYYQLLKGAGVAFKQFCITVQFYEISTILMVELLKHICHEEDITVETRVLQALAERCKGDMRSAINDLQALCINSKQLDLTSLDILGYRDREKIIFDALREIFKTRNIKKLQEMTKTVDISPEMMQLWIAENIPREYQTVPDIANAFDRISKSDVFLGRVYRRQYYGYWSYANDLMTSGVSLAKSHISPNTRYYPPSFLKHLKKQRSDQSYRNNLVAKLCDHLHISKKKTMKHFLVYLKQLFIYDIRFAVDLMQKLNLSENEIMFLLEPNHTHLLKRILQYSTQDEEQQTISSDSPLDMANSMVNETDKKQEVRQQKLF